ncbi:MAG: hypothetical protein MUC28_01905, partial [Planctomycetes bacterium]|nr:hypothetical protein [Planctomycetota bacterium]
PGLANKLMAPMAKVVTVTFEKSVLDYGAKAVWTGNPIRRYFREQCIQNNLLPARNEDRPVIMIIGGGTGAAGLNELISNALTRLTKHYNVIHITGKNKLSENSLKWVDKSYDYNYHHFEFLHVPDLKEAYVKAKVVISRCGLGTLTELCYFGKPAILIPLPGSHQEDNAQVFAQKKAAVVLNQYELTAEALTENLDKLIEDNYLRQELSERMKEVMEPGANEKILVQVDNILRIT